MVPGLVAERLRRVLEQQAVPRFGQHAAGDASGREEITDLVTRSCYSW